MTNPKLNLFPSKVHSTTSPVQQFTGMIPYKCISNNILSLTSDQIRIPLKQHTSCQKSKSTISQEVRFLPLQYSISSLGSYFSVSSSRTSFLCISRDLYVTILNYITLHNDNQQNDHHILNRNSISHLLFFSSISSPHVLYCLPTLPLLSAFLLNQNSWNKL